MCKCHARMCSSTDTLQPSACLHPLTGSASAHIHTYICISIHQRLYRRATFGSRWGYRHACRWARTKCSALTTALPDILNGPSIRMGSNPKAELHTPLTICIAAKPLALQVVQYLISDFNENTVCVELFTCGKVCSFGPQTTSNFSCHILFLTQFTFLEVWGKSKECSQHIFVDIFTGLTLQKHIYIYIYIWV